MTFPRRSAAVGALFMLVLLVGLPVAVRSQSAAAKSPLQGVWRITERTITDPASPAGVGKQTNPGPGLYIFTGKYYSQVVDTAVKDKPRPSIPDLTKATADQLRAVLTPLRAQSGTYELSQGTITLRSIVDRFPPAGSNTTTWSSTMEGKDTLVLTQKSDQTGPIAMPVTLKFTRVE